MAPPAVSAGPVAGAEEPPPPGCTRALTRTLVSLLPRARAALFGGKRGGGGGERLGTRTSFVERDGRYRRRRSEQSARAPGARIHGRCRLRRAVLGRGEEVDVRIDRGVLVITAGGVTEEVGLVGAALSARGKDGFELVEGDGKKRRTWRLCA